MQPHRSTMSPSSNRATWRAADLESPARRSVAHVLALVRPGHPKHQREVVVVVGQHDLGRECEIGERFEEPAPVVLGALEPFTLTVGGVVVDDVFGEELAEAVEIVGGDELAAEASALRFCSFDMMFLLERVFGVSAAERFGADYLCSLRNASSAALTSSACVQPMLCGPPSTGTSVQSAISAGSRAAVDVERKDPVLGAVHDEYRDVDLRQIRPEVGQPGIDACVAREGRGAGRDVEAGLPRAVADSGAAEDVDVVEVVEEVLEECVAIVGERGLDVGEDLAVDALGVVVGLEHERRDGAEQCCFAYPRSIRRWRGSA